MVAKYCVEMRRLERAPRELHEKSNPNPVRTKGFDGSNPRLCFASTLAAGAASREILAAVPNFAC